MNDLFLQSSITSGLGVAFVAPLRAQMPPVFLFRAAFADGVEHKAEAVPRFAALGVIEESVRLL